MNAIELLSVISAFVNTSSPVLYEEIMNFLCKEILEVTDLNTLALSVYVISNHYNYSSPQVPINKDTKHSSISSHFLGLISPRLINKITEFTDDQFATICAGIGRSSINPNDIDIIYPLMDAIQGEVVQRRAKRMSIENLVDVASGFFNNNLGEDVLAKLITGQIMEKRQELNYFTGVDYALSLSEREVCNKELLSAINKIVKDNIDSKDYIKISNYIINTECKDEVLIKKQLACLNSYRSYPKNNYQELKKFQYYLKKYFKHLVSDEFLEKVELCGYSFNAEHYLQNNLETSSKYFDEFDR